MALCQNKNIAIMIIIRIDYEFTWGLSRLYLLYVRMTIQD